MPPRHRLLPALLTAAFAVSTPGGTLAGGAPGRQPVPTGAAQEKAAALVREVFADELPAKDPADRTRLAAILLQQGRDAKDDPALRYVLHQQARELAAAGGDVSLAFAAAEELARTFDVDTLLLKAEVLARAAAEASDKDAAKGLVDQTLPLISAALAADHYEAAKALGQAADVAARKAKSASLVLDVQRRNEEIRGVEKGFARLQTFVDRLKTKPDDAEANLELGSYYAFLKRNWEKALPLLGKGADATLAGLAKADLAAPASPTDRLALGDAYWDAAASAKEPAKLALQARASYWYDRALPLLTGLNRTKAQKRVEQAAERLSGTVAQAPSGPVGELKKLEGHTDEVKSVAFSADGRYAASGGLDQTVRVWDLGTGKEDKTLRGHTKQVWSVAFLPSGRQVLSASWDASVRLWDVKAGNEVRRFTHRIDVNGLAVARDGATFLSGSDDHNVYLWNTTSGDELKRFIGHTNFVYAVAFSPDGRRVASGGVDKTVRVFDLNTGQQLKVIEGHNNSVTAVAFTPDNRHVLSAGDGVIHLWEIESGKEVRRFSGHAGSVPALALSADGRRLVTGGDDRTVRVWDVSTGKELHGFKGHGDTVTSVAISPDGRRALSGSIDRTVRLWGLPAR